MSSNITKLQELKYKKRCHILTVDSYNVRGIRTNSKRADHFAWLKSKNADVTILVDTHCHLLKERKRWSKEWSNKKQDSIWSMGAGNSRGVAILFNKKFWDRDVKLIESETKIHSSGRYIKIILEVEGCKYRILGVYAPNKGQARVNFILKMHEILEDDETAETIIGGDHNCTLDTLMDRRNCTSNSNDIGQIDMKYLIQTHDLEDIWRTRNPDSLKYTYFRGDKASRIDYFLTSISLNNQIDTVYAIYNPYSDHHGIRLIFRTQETVMGKGPWKMNASKILLPEFKQKFEEMWEEWRSCKHLYQDVTQWWDLGKQKIKHLARNFAIEKGIQHQDHIDQLELAIAEAQNNNLSTAEITNLQNEHGALLGQKLEGARVRSRLQWWEEGEKSTKYFHNLEKRNGKQKAWNKILDSRKNIVQGTKNIQKVQMDFYKDLFTSQGLNGDDGYFLGEPSPNTIPENIKNELDIDITREEIAKALKKMKNNKSPGQDGIVVEFYKTYWNIIGNDLLEVYRHGLQNESLSYSQYLALIVLLYKKGPREDIKNWRPISLLNVDYKILSKVMAERIKIVLPYIIHSDQKGCISGRYIGENIRLIEDLMTEIESLDDDCVIILQDQEKAFDRVEWTWLFQTLKYFNFGNKIISWLETMYRHSKSSIITNGYQSGYFKITRGIRQGDSLSALLYIIQQEPLAQKLRKSQDIHGIEIRLNHIQDEHITAKGCQYVDDSNTFLKNKTFIDNFVEIMDRYELVSGSKMNTDKTVALTLQETINEKIREIKLTRGPKDVLGVPVGGDRDKVDKNMWEKLIDKLREKLNIWKARDLSLEGRAYLIRSIGISQLLFALEMKTISDKQVKTIKEIIWDFLWKGKRFCFSRDICTLPRNKGGLGLIDIDITIKVKRIMWIIRFLKENSEQPWAKLVENYLRCLDNQYGVKLFTLKATDSTDQIKKAKIPQFYKECILNFQEMCRIAITEKFEPLIWCNHNFKFNGKPLNIRHWAKAGILRPSQLYTQGRLNPGNLKDQLTHKAGFIFEIQRIKKVFPLNKTDLQTAPPSIDQIDNKGDILNYEFKVSDTVTRTLENITSKEIYSIFLNNKKVTLLSKTYWNNYLALGLNFEWDDWYYLNFINKIIPRKCKDLNWKLFHGVLNTENRLKRMKYSNGICKSCHTEAENAEHLLIRCQYRQRIWNLIGNIINDLYPQINFNMTKTNIMAGFFNKEQEDRALIINLLLSMGRYHLWITRNAIKYDNISSTFIGAANRLKYYFLSHIKILLTSKLTNVGIKEDLGRLQNIIERKIHNRIRETDFG